MYLKYYTEYILANVSKIHFCRCIWIRNKNTAHYFVFSKLNTYSCTLKNYEPVRPNIATRSSPTSVAICFILQYIED